MSVLARAPSVRQLPNTDAPNHVTILMATKDGASTIDAQLHSIGAQTHRDWSLIVSDDGSSDDTLDRVRAFSDRHPQNRVICLRGPKLGSAMNFLSLLRAAGNAPWVAFSDQDDYWLPERLSRGLNMIEAHKGPAIYGGRTIITDSSLTPLRLSPAFQRPTGFGNALVQNVAGGNTMLLNRAALDALQPASRFVRQLVAHDWWCYQIVTSMGGKMIWDPTPTVLYRQHATNQIGANDSWRASLNRARRLCTGEFCDWCDVQMAALTPQSSRMTRQARSQLLAFARLRTARGPNRLRALYQAGIYRQTLRGSLALWVAGVLGRLSVTDASDPSARLPSQRSTQTKSSFDPVSNSAHHDP